MPDSGPLETLAEQWPFAAAFVMIIVIFLYFILKALDWLSKREDAHSTELKVFATQNREMVMKVAEGFRQSTESLYKRHEKLADRAISSIEENTRIAGELRGVIAHMYQQLQAVARKKGD